jgi:molybdopterin/thiamine biosynthesis adenylyltransferase
VVHASVFRFEGQLTTFVPYAGPCYRCLYPTPPPPELAPGCSVAGVLGVVPGIMGLLQSNEVLKLLLGIGEPLVGRLLLFDALDGSFDELRLSRDPACPTCSDDARAARERGEWVAPSPFGVDQPFALGAAIGGAPGYLGGAR